MPSPALYVIYPLEWLGAAGILAACVLGMLTTGRSRKTVRTASLVVAVLVLLGSPFIFVGHTRHPLGSRAQIQLRCIGSAIREYMFDHEYQLPTTLGATFPYVESASDYTVRGSGTPEPENAEDVDSGHCDFLYFGGGMHGRANADEGVLATTKPSIFDSRGYVCVLQDGHVETHKTVPEPIKAFWKAYPNGKPAPDRTD